MVIVIAALVFAIAWFLPDTACCTVEKHTTAAPIEQMVATPTPRTHARVRAAAAGSDVRTSGTHTSGTHTDIGAGTGAPLGHLLHRLRK
jgi:hypothetical protein